MTNSVGTAIVNAVGPIRQIVEGEVKGLYPAHPLYEADAFRRHYLAIVPGSVTGLCKPVQIPVSLLVRRSACSHGGVG
jgi:hypothetical protein